MRLLLRRVVVSAALVAMPLFSSVAAQSSGSAVPSHPAGSPETYSPDANGVYNVGGDVRPPVVVYKANLEFPERDRKNKVSGSVLVNLIVDAGGVPQNVHVEQGTGSVLDTKAVETVRAYKFNPGNERRRPCRGVGLLPDLLGPKLRC